MNTYLSRQPRSHQLYLALAFPRLAIDRLKKNISPESNNPRIVVSRTAKGLSLVAVDGKAGKAGLAPGMTLVAARSLCSTVETINADPDGDRAYLEQLARDAERFTPLVAYSLPHGIMLDVTGCSHLFGGPESMLKAIIHHYRCFGLETHAALTSNPAAARAFARFGKNQYVKKDALADQVDRLPLSALEIPPPVLTGLRRAGFSSIGDLRHLSAKVLAARFGEILPMKLQCLYGQKHVPISPLHTLPLFQVNHRLCEPVLNHDAIIASLTKMADHFFSNLEKHGVGSRVLEVGLFRVDGVCSKLSIETSGPLVKTAPFIELLREKLSSLATPLDIGYGFDAFALSAKQCEKLHSLQTDLIGEITDDQPLHFLIDRLSTRMGASHIAVAQSHESHIPEKAAFWRQSSSEMTSFTAYHSPSVPERPFRIFCPPQPIDVVATIPDAPPSLFRWRKLTHKIRLAEGPERICAEWWKSSSTTRDYYRLEDENGQRFWVFRQGLYHETTKPKWFIHGLFA